MILNINSQGVIGITSNILIVSEIQRRGYNMAGKTIILRIRTEQILMKMGYRIKKARLRRNIRAEVLAEQAGISKGTLSAVEKGISTVSIGAYAAVLHVLGMEEDFGFIAMDEEGKKKYHELCLLPRERATKRKDD